MTETRLCACGCGKPATGAFKGWENTVPDGTPYNGACLGGSFGVSDFALRMSCRAQPKAELEALDFVAPRNLTLRYRIGGRGPNPEYEQTIETGDRVRIEVAMDNHYKGLCAVLPRGCFVHSGDWPRIHAELLALRDGHSNATQPAPFAVGDRVECDGRVGVVTGMHANGAVYWTTDNGSKRANTADHLRPAPSAVEPKPNPLRGLAEAMRDLCRSVCVSCSAHLPMGGLRVEDSGHTGFRCVYCDRRARVPEPVQPAAVEEVRAAWDWDCEDVGYLP